MLTGYVYQIWPLLRRGDGEGEGVNRKCNYLLFKRKVWGCGSVTTWGHSWGSVD